MPTIVRTAGCGPPRPLLTWARGTALSSSRTGSRQACSSGSTNEDVASRTGSTVHLAGVLDRSAATVDPGALARSLARAAQDKGVRIYEQTEVVSFDKSDPGDARDRRRHHHRTEGSDRNERLGSEPRELRNALVVVSSDIVATPPIPDRLKQIGWTGGEAITNSQLMVNYYRTTKDGRIAFGKGGWGIAFGGHITARFDRDPHRAQAVANAFHATYPALKTSRSPPTGAARSTAARTACR